jgi:hypothetical protein
VGAITYTAASRAPLITDSPAHAAGISYSFDVKFTEFQTDIEVNQTQQVTLSGAVETILRRAADVIQISLIWPDTNNANMREFLYSVAAGESFSVDPYGSVASPDNPLTVIKTSGGSITPRMSHGATPWRMTSMTVREVSA